MAKASKPAARKSPPKMPVVQKPPHASRSAIRRAVKIVGEKFDKAHA
jgi:hypothetical protein